MVPSSILGSDMLLNMKDHWIAQRRACVLRCTTQERTSSYAPLPSLLVGCSEVKM